MLRDVRRLLVALVLACSGLVLAQGPAHACKCVDASTERSAQRADEVFTGTLRSASTDRADGREVTTYDIAVETLYKGDLTMASVEVSSVGSSCSLGRLPEDRRYVWFADADGGQLSSDQCSGTAKASDRLVERVRAVLGKGEELGGGPADEPQQQPAEFTRVADAEPSPLTRIAAPGVALVIVGLLGLFVVRRRAD